MDFKSLLTKIGELQQVQEAKEETASGVKHKGKYGTEYQGDADDEDTDGDKKKAKKAVAPAEKRGRGRPKKGADSSTGKLATYSGAKDLQDYIVGNKPSKAVDKLPKKKHTLKDWVEQIEGKYIVEAGLAVQPMPTTPQQKQQQQMASKPAFMIKDPANPTASAITTSDPAVVNAAKNGTLTMQKPGTTPTTPGAQPAQGAGSQVAPVHEEELDELSPQALGNYRTAALAQANKSGGIAKSLDRSAMGATNKESDRFRNSNRTDPNLKYQGGGDAYAKQSEKRFAGAAQALAKGAVRNEGGDDRLNEKDIGKHNNATTGFDALVRKLTPKYGVEAAKRIAGSQMKKIKEADIPPNDSLASPLSMEESKMSMKKVNGKSVPAFAADGKGKNDLTNKKVKEAVDAVSNTDKSKLPSVAHIKKMCKDGKTVAEICKMHPNCNQPELKKMIADCKKKMIKEGMDQRLQSARMEGNAHGLKGHSHCGRNYDDLEEARCYHEGYKAGLDECYGQMPIQGYVGEANPSVVDDMASFGARHDSDVEEGNAFTAALARTPRGGQFSVGGKRFKDRTRYDAPVDEMQSMAFEGWNNQLDKLLTEGDVSEGMSVSISKGQQGTPDSVSVTANDADADALLNLVKHAGLGLFGGGDGQGAFSPPTDGADSQAHGDIAVVNDHDGMMSLMKKLSGVEDGSSEGSDDYADEEGHDEEQEEPGHEHEEEVCGDCGEADCACDVSDDSEEVDEDQTDDQLEYQMAEDTEEDAGVAAAGAQQAGEDAALASAAGEADAADEEEPEEVEESYANGADDTFEADIDFMTKVISGGLNKQKSTGQSTIPVVASQTSRLGNPMQESTNLLHDWKKLSGIK